MSRVTSKRQITIPKVIADQYGIQRGSELCFTPAGDSIRIHLVEEPSQVDPEELTFRLQLFDAATQRQAARNERILDGAGSDIADRGWRREDVYDRGLPR